MPATLAILRNISPDPNTIRTEVISYVSTVTVNDGARAEYASDFLHCKLQQGSNKIQQPLMLPSVCTADERPKLGPNPTDHLLAADNRWKIFPEELWPADSAAGVLPKSRRGLHLSGRLDIPEAARKARPHWADKVKAVRDEWVKVAAGNADFRWKYNFWSAFAERRVGGKLECLVRTLHLAAAAGHIRPVRRGSPSASAIECPPPPRDERKGRPPKFVSGFSDWAGFVVERGGAADGAFRSAVWELFPAGVRETTVLATLRQSGVAPEGWHVSPKAWAWEAAWAGEVAFVLRPQRRRCPEMSAVGPAGSTGEGGGAR